MWFPTGLVLFLIVNGATAAYNFGRFTSTNYGAAAAPNYGAAAAPNYGAAAATNNGAAAVTNYGAAATTNYCDRKLCETAGGAAHVACGVQPMTLARACTNGRFVPLSASDKQFILDKHNQDRNLIASGGIRGYEPAANMPEVQWNDELAYLACFNVQTCVFGHDKCRNTRDYPFSGQNLGIKGRSSSHYSFLEAYEDLHDQWFNEKDKCSMSTIRSYQHNPAIGHFTLLVSEKAHEVGCCATQFDKGNMKTTLVACNYSYSNMMRQPIYTHGRPKCSKFSKKFGSLCS